MGVGLAALLGVGLIAGYVAFGVWAIKRVWAWSAEFKARWLRLLAVSVVATALFMPGVVGGGHGAGVGPAWLMFATGTFGALTGASQITFLVATAFGWAIAFAATHLLTRKARRTEWDRSLF